MTQSLPPKSIILYADDDTDDLDLVKESFQHYSNNVEVVTVRDGVEALSYLNNLKPLDPEPCLVILDINMPRLNGKETLQHIKNIDRFAALPVILFTTSSQYQDHAFAREHGAGFLTKPIDSRQMEIIVDQFIEHCTEEVKKKIRRQLK